MSTMWLVVLLIFSKGIMRLKRYALSAGVVLALVGTSVFSALPATAATPQPDFTPSPNKPRAYIINVLGSMLGKSMPSGWKAEQIANEYRYNHSFEQLEVATGLRADATDGYLMTSDYMNNPQTKADYDLRHAELQFKGGRDGKTPLRPPITASSSVKKFTKSTVGAVGGAVTAFTGYQIGAQIGGGLVSLFGIDARGEVCTGTGGWETMLSLATGVSCEGFNADQYYEFNADVTERQAGLSEPAVYEVPWGNSGQGVLALTDLDIETPFRTIGAGSKIEGSASATIGGTCANNGWPPSDVQVRVYQKRPSDGVVSFWSFTLIGTNGKLGSIGYPCSKLQTSGSFSLDLNAYSYFDHLGIVSGSKEVLWYPEGHALWQPGTDADPARTFECVVTGDDGIDYTAVTEEFREEGEWSAPVCPELPDGVTPVNIGVNQNTAGGGSQSVYDEPVSQDYLDWRSAYPECLTGACKLDLKIGTVNGSGLEAPSCFDTPDSCVSWFEDPLREESYQCTYGMHDVDLSECYVYAGIFDPARIAVGSPYSNPMTGEWSGGQSAPKPDSQALAQGIQNPELMRSCNGMNITGFDPVGFVMRPVQCALEWAFVPRAGVLEYEATKMTSSLDNVAPGQLVALLSSWEIDPSPMTGCRRAVPWSPSDTFGTGTGETVVWDVCPGAPLEFLGTISRSVVAVAFALLVFLSLKRSTSATVDYR